MRALDEDYDGFAAFPPHGWTVSVAALLAEACLAMSPAGRRSAAGAARRKTRSAGCSPTSPARLRAILARTRASSSWPAGRRCCSARPSASPGCSPWPRASFEEALHLFDAVSGKVAGAPPQAARLQVDKARALIRLAQAGGGRAGQAAAARLLTEAGSDADRLGMRALAGEAGELLAEC